MDRMFDTLHCAPSPPARQGNLLSLVVTERALAAEHTSLLSLSKGQTGITFTSVHPHRSVLLGWLTYYGQRVDEPGKRDRQDCDVTWNEKADERAFVNKLIAACRARAGSHLRKVQRAQEHKLGQESVNSPKRRAPRERGDFGLEPASPTSTPPSRPFSPPRGKQLAAPIRTVELDPSESLLLLHALALERRAENPNSLTLTLNVASFGPSHQ